jgi:hypothetical protein
MEGVEEQNEFPYAAPTGSPSTPQIPPAPQNAEDAMAAAGIVRRILAFLDHKWLLLSHEEQLEYDAMMQDLALYYHRLLDYTESLLMGRRVREHGKFSSCSSYVSRS